MADASVIVTFEGLMVFRRDRVGDLYDVGIMRTKNMGSIGLPDVPDHLSKITVRPDPASGSGEKVINEAEIDRRLEEGNVWNLDVVGADGNIRKGIHAQQEAQPPIDRQNRDSKQNDFAWMMDIRELHGRTSMMPGKLKPVIRMSNGILSTIFKTHGVDLLHGPIAKPTVVDFGYIGETAGLAINLQPNEALILKVGNTEIFRIDHNPAISYEVKIENVMPPETGHDHDDEDEDDRSRPGSIDPHFQAYYELLFPDVAPGDRRVLRLTKPLKPSPNKPPLDTIHPFKCGGITMKDGDGPLE
jgi:hypothetical protein